MVTTTHAQAVGEAFTLSSEVDKFSFTGSTRVGKELARQCSGTVKKLSLELGGNAPFIVFEDADLDAAVAGFVASKFRNSGQTCVSANRLFVQQSIYSLFLQRLKEVMENLSLGDGMHEETTLGPLINPQAAARVNDLVSDALNQGAVAELGGLADQAESGPCFYPATLLTGVTPQMAIVQEEIFGPVVPMMSFESEIDAVALANQTAMGLAGYFYSRDNARIWRVAEQLEFGMLGINEGIISNAAAPFGGVKESGFGREGSKYGIDDYLSIKYLCVGGINS